MDAYDGIIEQLRKAQKRGVEAVTNRLDFVMESLDELVKEAKAAVQEAVPQEAEELFPLAEVEDAVAAAKKQLEAVEHRAGQLHEQLGEAAGEEPAGAGLSLALLRLMDKPRSQSELLGELLPALTSFVGRAAVLVQRDDNIAAWSGIGFESGEKLRQWRAETGASQVFRRFAADSAPVRFHPAEDPVFSSWLKGERPASEGLIVPVCLRGKTVGGVYMDRIDGRPWDPDSAQAMVALTCWLIDTLSVRATVPSPPLAEAADLRGAVGEPEPAPAEEPVTPEEPEALEATESIEELSAPEEPEVTDPSVTMRVEAGQLPTVEASPEALPEVEAEAPPEAPPEAEVAVAEVVEAPLEEETEEAPTHEPPAVSPVAPPDDPPAVSAVVPPADLPPAEEVSEHQAQLDEAQRFARLLVSEIKLYNEEEVELGRTSQDLYHRLKEDIDRSREMFDKRVAPEVREERDFFQEELVRILAGGDADSLGM